MFRDSARDYWKEINKLSYLLEGGGCSARRRRRSLYSESHTRQAQFLTRWDQHAVARGGVGDH